MENLEIQKASIDHVPEIWSNIQTSFSGVHSEYVATGQTGFKKYLENLISSEPESSKKIIVALVEGEPAAFADVNLDYKGVNFLTRIGVFPRFRGQGIAQRLMQQISSQMGEGRIWELDVLRENSSARNLYKKQGFQTLRTSQWIGKNLSADKNKNLSRSVNEEYFHYGFTNVIVDNRSVAIVGDAVRCSSFEDFLDDEFIASVQGEYPFLTRVFTLVSERRQDINWDEVFFITESYRMSGYF